MSDNIPDRTGILIVEDLPVYLPMFIGWIGPTAYQIVGPARNKDEALNLIKTNKSSLVAAFVDLYIPENKDRPKAKKQYGVDVISTLKDLDIPIVVASDYIPHDVLYDAVKSKYSFLYKKDMNEVMVRHALEQTVMRSALFSETVLTELERLIEDMKMKNPLEDIEWEILESRLAGNPLKQIAGETTFAYPSIRRKISDIYKKIGVINTQEAHRWYEKNVTRFGRRNIFEDISD